MGRGSSKVGGGGGGGAAKTPSGVTYQQFMQMSEQQKFNTIGDILADQNIQVPSYLDDSDTTKVLYGLGMANKPTVVDDATLDSMPGRELFRTVYEQRGSMPPPSSDAILDQIANGDYTQMSGSGGSAHGRAIYFATNFGDSADYGKGRQNPYVGRAKIDSNARIVSESTLLSQMQAKGLSGNTYSHSNFGKSLVSGRDARALYALSQGIDGWYSGSYTMIVNRGALVMSSSFKSLHGTYKRGANRGQLKPGYARSWNTAG